MAHFSVMNAGASDTDQVGIRGEVGVVARLLLER